jgi:hypothetical protein
VVAPGSETASDSGCYMSRPTQPPRQANIGSLHCHAEEAASVAEAARHSHGCDGGLPLPVYYALPARMLEFLTPVNSAITPLEAWPCF